MKSTVATGEHRHPSAGERTALLALLGDEDPRVFRAVRDRLLECAPEAAQWLREHRLSQDPVTRRHAREIVHLIERQTADRRFLGFCLGHGQDLDLEQGLWLLARTLYPEINVDAYRALLDQFAAELREVLPDAPSPLGRLAVVNDHLFNELGFHGNEQDYYDPDNSYFNRVIDRRTGNPISLSLLYWLLGRRLGLPIVGIGMPGHYVCRYQTSTDLVFIDAFNRGKLLTRSDCIRFLHESGHGFHDAFLAPATPRSTLLRVCTNLHEVYADRGLREETARLRRYLVALSG
jgi:regulator of sirC expression with transglutaminase-like and TPR domain